MPPTNTNINTNNTPPPPPPPPSLAAKHQARISEILASSNPTLRIQLLRNQVDQCTHDRISLSLDIMIEYHEFSARMFDHQTRVARGMMMQAQAQAQAHDVLGQFISEEMTRVHEVTTRKMLKEHDDVGLARDLAEVYIAAAMRGWV